MKIFGQHDEKTLIQLEDVASRAAKAALMADGHVGYVMPIGGVAPYRDQVSVVGVGFDIACGNAAIRTDLTLADVEPALPALADCIASTVSFGVGRKNRADDAPTDHPLFDDAAWRCATRRAASSGRWAAAITTWTCSPTRPITCGSACTSAAAALATAWRTASWR